MSTKPPKDGEGQETSILLGRVPLANILKDSGLTSSTSEARRLIKQGGVKVDGEKVSDINMELKAGQTVLIQVGKRRFKRVNLTADKKG